MIASTFEQMQERQAIALERIADALEAIAAPMLMPAPECPHPEAEREDTGSTMGHPRWRCKACGYEVSS